MFFQCDEEELSKIYKYISYQQMKHELASLLGKFHFERISSSLNSFNFTFLFRFISC